MADDVARRRLANQRLVEPRLERPADVVGWLGAVQAQDYRGSLWGIAQRTDAATEADVERAVAERLIVRSWPMRGTLHFVAGDDLRWMLRLLAPRVVKRSAGRYRELGLADADFGKSKRLLSKALQDGRSLTRPEAYALLARGGVDPAGQRGIHILGRLAMEGLLCLGAHRGKQPTFALLDEWVPASRSLDGDEALGELARRYFASHGPATVRDLAWWTGLPLGETRRGLEVARAHLIEDRSGDELMYSSPEAEAAKRRGPSVHILPAYDEYTVAYRDRSALLDPAHTARLRNGIFSPVVVVDGRVVGTWRRATTGKQVTVTVDPIAPLAVGARRALAAAAVRYGQSLGIAARLSFSGE